jgi:uncharacterized protein YecA (UPF0149 family)
VEVKEIDIADFSIKALPEIEKLAEHFKIHESAAVEAYGYLMKMANDNKVLTFTRCQAMVRNMLTKPVDKLNYEETRIGFCLNLLRVKQKPFLSDPKLRVGRNEPCPCGSGAKFKNCCLSDTKKHNIERYKKQNTILK